MSATQMRAVYTYIHL